MACALGELGAREAGEVRRHAASCPRCAAALHEMETIAGALRSLPPVEPGDGVWAGVREAVEYRGHAPRPSWFGVLFRPYSLAGAAAALLLGLGVFRLAGRGPAVPAERRLAVREMAGTFARRTPRGEASAYLREARLVVADALRCADGGDEACWRGLKARVEARGLRARGERCASRDASRLPPEQRALVEDSLRLVRAIGDWPPSRLASEGAALGRELRRADLPARLGREGAP